MVNGGNRDRSRLGPGGADWRDPAYVARAEALRLALERDTQTYRGFRRRVRTDREWSILGAIIGVPCLVALLVDPVWWFVSAPSMTVWKQFVLSGQVWWAAVWATLIMSSLISSAVRVRREFALFRKDGWIAYCAPTGLVQLNTDGPTSIEYDHRAVGGQSMYSARDFGDPLMLVSGANVRAESFRVIVEAVRASTVRRALGHRSRVTLKQRSSLLRSVSAEAWFPEASQCLLGVTRDAPLTVAIPRPLRDGSCRTRLGRVRFTAAERAGRV